jgi:hypothetical protein
LDGSYIYPENFDQATKELCIECALIHKIIPENSVKIKMTKDNFILHWKKAKEETSSSYSGLHCGHYKVGTASAYISHFHALNCPQMLGPRALGDAPKIVWLLPHHETTLHTTDGGGF